MYWVNLAGIYGMDAIPPEMRGFVDFQANVEGRDLTGKERVAVLVVENTESYIPVFIDYLESIEDLERRLEAQESRMTAKTKSDLLMALGQS